jgi:hypothetical protein
MARNNNHDVCIEDVGGAFRVTPATAFVNPKDGFVILNSTEYPVVVALPPDLTREDPKKLHARSRESFSVKKDPIRRSYSVVVYTETGLVSAQGNSDPVIIIDPPA